MGFVTFCTLEHYFSNKCKSPAFGKCQSLKIEDPNVN